MNRYPIFAIEMRRRPAERAATKRRGLRLLAIGGRKISDRAQIPNLAESFKRLLAMVKSGQFSLSKNAFTIS